MGQKIELSSVVLDFAAGLEAADALRPEWVSRSGRAYAAGIGPHAEVRTVELVVDQMRASQGRRYGAIGPVDYPHSRLKCDLGIGDPLEWAIEVKMARAFGDNGKLDDIWLKDLLSPYPSDHSALSDASKLRASAFDCRMAILVYGFDYPTHPLEMALHALDVLLRDAVVVDSPISAEFADLVHAVHARGRVTAWEILGERAAGQLGSSDVPVSG
jgi:hypothetical protein